MFNLLPITEKNLLKREYHFRLAIVAFSMFLFTLLAAFLLMIPSYVLTASQESFIAKNQTLVGQEINDTDKAYSRELAKIKDELAVLMPKSGSLKLSNFVADLIADRTKDIKISNLVLTPDADGKSTILISGVAGKRVSLLDFTKAVESERGVSSVNTPVSNFAKDVDIEFAITVKGPAF